MDSANYRKPAADQLAGTMFATAPIASAADERAAVLNIPDAIPGYLTRWASLTEAERRQQRERWQALLLPIVKEMASVASGDGITANDVISRGITDGVLNGERSFLGQHPRVYSFVGLWLLSLTRGDSPVLAPKLLKIEGGGSVHARRRAERDASKGNQNYVFVSASLASQRAA